MNYYNGVNLHIEPFKALFATTLNYQTNAVIALVLALRAMTHIVHCVVGMLTFVNLTFQEGPLKGHSQHHV